MGNFSIIIHAAHSFIELVEYVFTLPDISVFLSQRISQDPLENFLVVSGNKVGLMTTRMFKNSRRICRPYELSTHL